MPDEIPKTPQSFDDAALNTMTVSCNRCRTPETLPFSKIRVSIKGGVVVLKFTCSRCHTERTIRIRPGETV